MKYDIADILEVRDVSQLLGIMQDQFEGRIGSQRFFRITGTPVSVEKVRAPLDNNQLAELLENPPNPNGRWAGWDVKPLPPLKRTPLGFENDRIDFHHLKFIKNGHLEFWTAIDQSFCWQQDIEAFMKHPRFYPYAVVEHPVSFVRLYRKVVDLLGIEGQVVFQMEYLNVLGCILLPYQPESIGFQHPLEPVKPLEDERLVFERRSYPKDFDPDPVSLEIIKDLYYAFGYLQKHIPFFDDSGHCRL